MHYSKMYKSQQVAAVLVWSSAPLHSSPLTISGVIRFIAPLGPRVVFAYTPRFLNGTFKLYLNCDIKLIM